MRYTRATAPNAPALKNLHHSQDLPVECGSPDSNSVQTQCSSVDGFIREKVVPLYVHFSKDYKACVHQNGDQFGYIIFERCSDTIRYIMKLQGCDNLMNYIDDLIYIGLPSKIHQFYQFLLSFLQDLGLQVSQSKLVSPHTEVTCLGIVVNTIKSTISIPADKLQNNNVCTHWNSKSTSTKRQLQSLLGSLLYITNCIILGSS